MNEREGDGVFVEFLTTLCALIPLSTLFDIKLLRKQNIFRGAEEEAGVWEGGINWSLGLAKIPGLHPPLSLNEPLACELPCFFFVLGVG